MIKCLSIFNKCFKEPYTPYKEKVINENHIKNDIKNKLKNKNTTLIL
jgi:hypothetical protein